MENSVKKDECAAKSSVPHGCGSDAGDRRMGRTTRHPITEGARPRGDRSWLEIRELNGLKNPWCGRTVEVFAGQVGSGYHGVAQKRSIRRMPARL